MGVPGPHSELLCKTPLQAKQASAHFVSQCACELLTARQRQGVHVIRCPLRHLATTVRHLPTYCNSLHEVTVTLQKQQ